MEDIVQKAIQRTQALKKQLDSVTWKPDEPCAQPFYSWSGDTEKWEPLEPTASASAGKKTAGIDGISLFSWNIDFMLPSPKERMDAALAHLEKLTAQLLSDSTTAVVIYLQECIPSDLVTIGQQQWIKDRFYVTDINEASWASGAYGTTTLIDRRLDISSCFRVHYSKTQMERDALFVDVEFQKPGQKLRLCNTHLESLALEPQFRPLQMKLVAECMHANDIAAAVVAGDFNAIQPSDASIHADNNLKDAYLEHGGQNNAEEGNTWGQQALPALRQQFGCSRLDKVFFRGGPIKLQSFQRFGADVELGEEQEEEGRSQLLALGFEKAWITDHLGINAVFSFTSGHDRQED